MQEERGSGRGKEEQHILKNVLRKMSVNFHTLRMMEMAAVLPGGGGERNLMWGIVLLQRGSGNVKRALELHFFLTYISSQPEELKTVI